MARDLAQRTESAVQQQNGAAPTLAQLIERMKPEIARALPANMNPDRMARIALSVLNGNKQLQECTPASFLGALMTATQLGLEPGALGESYLVPFKRRAQDGSWTTECTFIPGYKGLVKLVWQSGQIEGLGAEVVKENDHFVFQLGTHRDVDHSYDLKMTEAERGRVIGVYATAEFKGGGKAISVMSIGEVEKIRARSKSGQKGPWVTDFDEMAKKTVLRRLVKMLPMSTIPMQLAGRAADLDGSVRTDVRPIEEATPAYYPGQLADTEQGQVDTVTGEVSSEDAFPPGDAAPLEGDVEDPPGWTDQP